MHKFSVVVIVGMFLLSACSSGGSLKSKQAIQEAIQSHLKNDPQLSLKNFNTQVESVKFKGDTADALAKFVTKQAPHMAVNVRYQLKLEGGKWKVVSSQAAGGQGMGMHGEAGGTMGAGGMGTGGMGTGGKTGEPSMAPSHQQGNSTPGPQSSH